MSVDQGFATTNASRSVGSGTLPRSKIETPRTLVLNETAMAILMSLPRRLDRSGLR